MTVLILASASDPHALKVSEHLLKMGTAHRIWNFADFVSKTSFSFTPDNSNDPSHLHFDDGGKVDLDQVESIWFRRPGPFQTKLMPEPWVEAIVESECRNACGGMLRSLDCLFVNHPGRDADSLFKLSQLAAAKKVGLAVPETIVTNEPEVVSEFYRRLEGKVIYKLIGESSNFCFPAFEFPAGIPTLPFRASDLEHLEQVRLAPHLFQQRIEKSYEIRATVVGEAIFAARIDSQKGDSKLDWRMDYSVPMQKWTLPRELATGIVSLMKIFELNYAAFDFCVDEDERYYFLELNCGGQYMWIEERVGFQISRQLALLLSGQAKAIVDRGSARALGA